MISYDTFGYEGINEKGLLGGFRLPTDRERVDGIAAWCHARRHDRI